MLGFRIQTSACLSIEFELELRVYTPNSLRLVSRVGWMTNLKMREGTDSGTILSSSRVPVS